MNAIAGQKHELRNVRPVDHADLLYEPITDDEVGGRNRARPDWEREHGSMRRFRVGGFVWFLRTRAVTDAKALTRYSDEAVEIVRRNTRWTEMLGSPRNWEGVSYNQYRYAQDGKPIFFQKAALILVACELALESALSADKAPAELRDGKAVYQNMKIVPACWNIDGLYPDYLKDLENKKKGALFALSDAAGQSSPAILHDLARGHTVTRRTANAIKSYLDMHLPELPVGRVRAHSGRMLGTLNASEREFVDLEP